MELRKLKSLLGALRAAGVTSYRDGDLTLEFGAQMMPVPTGDIEGFGPMELPPGVVDAAAELARIRKTYAKVRS